MNPATAMSPAQACGTATALLLSAALLAGCLTPPALPRFDTSIPGWLVDTTQAVWTPARNAAPIAGDVVVARHPDGRVLVEMSKASLPIASLRLTPAAWQFEVSSRRRSYGGSGPPPPRSAWLVFAQDLAGGPRPAPWSFSAPAPGIWLVQNPSSGESLEIQEPPGHPFHRQP